MKSVTTVVALAICSFFTGASAVAQAQVPPTTISFDGFCDGMSLTFSSGNVGGQLSGCLAGLGIVGGKVFATTFTGTEMQLTSTVNAGCALNYYFDIPSKTWTNYQTCDGSVPVAFYTGTFSYTQPNPTRGSPSNIKP